MNRKIRFYLYILGILWLGAAAEAFVSAGDGHYGQSIEAVLMEESYPGELTEKEKEALAAKIFAEKKAEPVQAVADDGMFSAYGYTPSIKDYVVSEGRKINLNMIAAYDEEADVTRIILASPIYNEDY